VSVHLNHRNTGIVQLVFTVLLFSPACVQADEIQVKTVRYDEVAYQPEHSTSAQVIAKQNSQISAEITAVVIDIFFDTGERVNKGETVIALDCRSNELQLKQALAVHEAAMAQYENAKKLLESAKKLLTNNNISQELYDQRDADATRNRAETNQTWAGIKTAQLAVERCTINAPFDGYISKRMISIGELVQPGTPIFEMVIAGASEIEANISSAEYESFIAGEDFQYQYKNTTYPVEVINILPVIDPNYRTHTTRLKFTQQSAPTGSNGSLRWKDSQYAIPPNLIVLREGQNGVMLAKQGKAVFVAINNYVEGLPGIIDLEADMQIITTGRHALKNGDSISIKN
jgi:membrane fusion protein (multidrug efflux system)